jgi:hypothetical protein
MVWNRKRTFSYCAAQLRRALAGHSASTSIVIFLSPSVFFSNVIGGSGSLEQPAPSPLQVAVSFNRILNLGRTGFNFRIPFQVTLSRPAWADAGLHRWL